MQGWACNRYVELANWSRQNTPRASLTPMLFVMEVATRHVHIVGVTPIRTARGPPTGPQPRHGPWRPDHLVPLLHPRRDVKFTSAFDEIFASEGATIVKTQPQTPQANAICEWAIGTLRRELLGRLLIVNEHHLRRALTEYLQHYNTARPHRALGQLAPAQDHTRPPEINLAGHQIRRNKSSAGLRTSTRSLPDNPGLLREDAGQHPHPVFEPNGVPGGSRLGAKPAAPPASAFTVAT
jgi:putative transposase